MVITPVPQLIKTMNSKGYGIATLPVHFSLWVLHGDHCDGSPTSDEAQSQNSHNSVLSDGRSRYELERGTARGPFALTVTGLFN